MEIILITNRKGGVGKTTTTVNLSTWLALLGKKVLILDLDTQSHIQYAFGYNEPFKRGIHQAIKKRRKINSFIQKTPYENLFFVPADINFNVNSINSDDVYLLEKMFKKSRLENEFDICVIDTAPTSNLLLLNALAISKYALVPFKTEFLGVVAVKQFLKMFYEIASQVNESIELLGLLPTMFNKSMKEHSLIVSQVEESIGKSRVLEPIRNDMKLSSAFLDGKPVAHIDKRCRGSQDYKSLANEVINRL